MSQHSFCSASKLQRAALCSAAPYEESLLKEEIESEDARIGTEKHKYINDLINSKITVPEIPREYRESIISAVQMFLMYFGDEILVNGRTANGGYWFSELTLPCISASVFGYTDFGTVDFHAVYPNEKRIFMLDWKFGSALIHAPSFNMQLQDYCLSLWDKYGIDYTIECTYIQPEARNKYNAQPWSFSPDDRVWMLEKIKKIREASYSLDVVYSVGPACKFCSAKSSGTCWARHNYIANFSAAKPITREEVFSLDEESLNRVLDVARCSEIEAHRIVGIVKERIKEEAISLMDWKLDHSSNRLTSRIGYKGVSTFAQQFSRKVSRTIANSKKI